MARLSVEHSRANFNMTPERIRKSGRFRDIFKSRSSSSPSSTADPSAKSPEEGSHGSPPTSPISPTIKPGFEKVGILPGERSSFVEATHELERNGGSHVAEVLVKQEEELKGVGVPHNVDTSLDAAHVSHQEEIVEEASKQDKKSNARAVAIAFADAMVALQSEDGDSAAPEEKHKLRHRHGRQNLSVDEGTDFEASLSTEQSSFFDLNAGTELGNMSILVTTDIHVESERCPPDLGPNDFLPFETKIWSDCDLRSAIQRDPGDSKSSDGVFSDAGDETLPNTYGEQCSRRDSFTSNVFASTVFDDQDPLSVRIREYVDSRVAKAMVDYDCVHARGVQNDKTRTKITFKVDVPGFVKNPNEKTDAKANQPRGPAKAKHISGWVVQDPSTAAALQYMIIILYTVPLWLILNALSVPTPLVLVLLAAKVLKLGSLCVGSDDEASADMLLAPLLVARAWSGYVLRSMAKSVIKMAVEVLREVADEMDVELDSTRD